MAGNEKIYLAGPMTGYPEYNYPAFALAASRFRKMGFEVVCPPELNEEEDSLDYHPAYYLRKDLRQLLDCSGIHLLRGWPNSRGACVEAAVALTLDLNFYDKFGNIIAPPRQIICTAYPVPR